VHRDVFRLRQELAADMRLAELKAKMGLPPASGGGTPKQLPQKQESGSDEKKNLPPKASSED